MADMNAQLIGAAVNWWADKLVSCKQSGLSPEERRDPCNESYQLAELLMQMGKPKVTRDQIENFKDRLTSALLEKKPRSLSVDYQPDAILAEALRSVGIDAGMGTLPIKTHMWIDADKVEVAYGYGAKPEVIFPSGQVKSVTQESGK